jgi:hypothetical protein
VTAVGIVVQALGVLALAAGIAAVLISLPDRAWQRAMVRLSERLRDQGLNPLPRSTSPAAAELDHRSTVPAPSGSSLTGRSVSPEPGPPSAPAAESLLDRVIDGVIEALRRMIGTRGFPRTALRVLGVLLLVFAMACFVLGSLVNQGERDNEEGARSSAPSAERYGAATVGGPTRAARQWLGERPRARLNARLNASSES